MRAAVDRQDHGIGAVRIEAGGLHDPALDAERIRVIPDFFHLAKSDAVEDVGVHLGQAGDVARTRQVEPVDVAGLVRARDRADRNTAAGNDDSERSCLPSVSCVTPPSIDTK